MNVVAAAKLAKVVTTASSVTLNRHVATALGLLKAPPMATLPAGAAAKIFGRWAELEPANAREDFLRRFAAPAGAAFLNEPHFSALGIIRGELVGVKGTAELRVSRLSNGVGVDTVSLRDLAVGPFGLATTASLKSVERAFTRWGAKLVAHETTERQGSLTFMKGSEFHHYRYQQVSGVPQLKELRMSVDRA